MDHLEVRPSPKPERHRRWPIVLGLALALIVASIAGLPWWLSSTAGNRFIAGRLARAFAPGRLGVKSIRLSWTAPTRLDGLTLDDPTGKRVVTAPSATVSANLVDLIVRPKRLGTLRLNDAAIEVTRRADGTLDLTDALASILAQPDPRRDLTIRAEAAALRVLTPGVAAPLVEARMDLAIVGRPAPAPLEWDVELAKAEGQSLKIVGTLDRWRAEPTSREVPNLSVTLRATAWPLAFPAQGIDLAGALGGRARVRREGGQLRSDGLAAVTSFVASGPTLRGDRLELPSLAAEWSIARAGEAWSVDHLGLRTPVGTLSAVVPSAADGPTRIEGDIDLAALARQLPHALRLREGLSLERGSAHLAVAASPAKDGEDWSIEARVSDLSARRDGRAIGLREPAILSSLISRRGGGLAVERLSLRTTFIEATAAGDLDRGIELTASADLAGLRTQLGDWVDLGTLEMDGKAVIKAGYRRSSPGGFASHARLDAERLRLDGLGSLPIRLARAVAEATIDGSAGPSGLPDALGAARIDLKTGEAAFSADYRTGGELNLAAGGPVSAGGGLMRGEATLAGRWDGAVRSLAIRELRAALRRGSRDTPTDLALTATGRLDFERGTLSLRPTGPDGAAGAIGIGPEGIEVVGLNGAVGSIRADVGLVGDLGRLGTAWTGSAPVGLSGRWAAFASARPRDDGLDLATRLDLADLAGDATTGRASAAARMLYQPERNRIEIAEIALRTAYATLQGTGTIDRLDGPGRVDLKGSLAPDWPALSRLLADRVEPGATLRGGSRPFVVKGPLGPGDLAGPPEPLDAELGLNVEGADLFGMKLGATAIVIHSRGGDLAIDPIETTLNGGRLHLEPSVVTGGQGGPMIHLGEESLLRDAVVNEEVSRRVLSYVAPVLDRTTRASGRVSVEIDNADFPIVRDAGRRASVSGSVVFQDLEFAPGPLARQLFAIVSAREPQTVRLNDPVFLSIADGRINQRGLAFPLGEITRIELEGWVDFDKNLGLVASLPITPAMFPNSPFLGDVVSGTKIKIPIGGSLASPRLDRDAFNVAMKDLGKNLLTRGAGLGALQLLNNLAKPRPRDPDAPPPPTAEERRMQRLERRNERRLNRGLPPIPGG